RLPRCAEQERRATILRRAADRADAMTEEPAGELRREDHRHGLRLDLPRAEPPQRAFRRLPADALRRLERSGLAAHRVPVVALEGAVALRDDADARRMRARRITADEAVAVRVRAVPAAGRHGRALGVLDPRIDGARGILGAQ